MKYGIAKQNAQQFANERKQPVYIARAVEKNHFKILFDKDDVSPNYRVWETVTPTSTDFVHGEMHSGKDWESF